MLPLLLDPIGSEQTVQMIKGSDETRAFIQKIGLAFGTKATV